jgi:inosine-uridine nucleoside N-ribohydrolase
VQLDIPVAQGCDRPLIAEAPFSPRMNGKSGLDAVDLPKPAAAPLEQHAVDFIIEQANRFRDELVIAALGPQTNLAIALRMQPKLAHWVREFTIMGGSSDVGTLTPVACVNILCDPEAAHIVLSSGAQIRWIGHEMTQHVLLQDAHIARLAQGGRVSRAAGRIASHFMACQREMMGVDGAPLHDVCAIVPYIRDTLVGYQSFPVQVELNSPLTRGMTVVDRRTQSFGAELKSLHPRRAPNAALAVRLEAEPIIDELVSTILAYD